MDRGQKLVRGTAHGQPPQRMSHGIVAPEVLAILESPAAANMGYQGTDHQGRCRVPSRQRKSRDPHLRGSQRDGLDGM